MLPKENYIVPTGLMSGNCVLNKLNERVILMELEVPTLGAIKTGLKQIYIEFDIQPYPLHLTISGSYVLYKLNGLF